MIIDWVTIVVSILGVAIPFLLRLWFKEKSTKAESNFLLGVKVAYLVVNNIAKVTNNQIDDKVALGLKALEDYLGKPVKEIDAQRAKELFDAMHEKEKAGEPIIPVAPPAKEVP